MGERVMDTPHSYAAHLATYIASPTKIEKLVALEFDHVPPLREIANMRFHVEQQIKRFKRLTVLGLEEVAEPELRTYPKSGTVYAPARVEIAECAIPDLSPRSHREVVTSVAKAFGLTYADVVSRGRRTALVCARAVAARILRDRGNSYPQIGRYLGNRDHSTIINLIEKYEARVARYPEMGVVYELLKHAKVMAA
jgi:hypothetical protein